MEHITITKLVYNPAETKRRRIAYRQDIEIGIWTVTLKLLAFITVVNAWFNWDKIVKLMGN